MNDYPEKPHDSFDPSAFDADAFLGDSLDMKDEFESFIQEMQAEEIASENTVIDVLEKVGLPVSPIRTSQARFAPEEPLAATLEKLVPMRDRLLAAGKVRDAAAVHNIIVLSIAIQDVAGQKRISNELVDDSKTQSASKKEQQTAIYANDQLLPEYKEIFLAGIDELYPNVDGLEPDSPATAASIQEYRLEQATQTEVTEKARALRDLAYSALRNAMVELDLGEHDQLDGLARSIIVVLTREYIIETGNYTDEHRAEEAFATRTALKGMYEEAKAMGWSEAQIEAVLKSIQTKLREAEN